MKSKPDYFDKIRNRSLARWNKLENDPELAAPWWQLFNQIQSPRHVISELLQNADDVLADQANIQVQDDVFLFQHNGKDFREEDFESLCRFGYSNKRKLHTIGFRGIGFKSIFSLGERVEVFSPSLQVAFDKKRFTEPIWLNSDEVFNSLTTIRVRFDDKKIADLVKKILSSWIENPVSLLFFQNIKSLSLNGTVIRKKVIRKGPVKNSQWVSLISGNTSKEVLIIYSSPRGVSEEIQQEVKEERNDPEFSVPPLEISLVLGLERQQIYEVLPTNVELYLPFSINAPFIQDPARTGIKEPSKSPLNDWLLQSAGELAASSFVEWLSNEKLSLDERAGAYDLLPDPQIPQNSGISAECSQQIVNAFAEFHSDQNVLLTSRGSLSNQQECLGLDADLLKVWNSEYLVSKFGSGHRFVLAEQVSVQTRTKLQQWNLLNRVPPREILKNLAKEEAPPNPGRESLKHLWNYVGGELESMGYFKKEILKKLRIIPARSRKELYPASQMLMPSKKDKQLKPEEFRFLQRHLILMDEEWYSYIQHLQNIPSDQLEPFEIRIINLFKELGLESAASLEKVIQEAVKDIFSLADPSQDGLEIARIIARLNIEPPQDFKFLCADGQWRSVRETVLSMDEMELERLLLPSYRKWAISDQYEQGLSGTDLTTWLNWKNSIKSCLHRFITPFQKLVEGIKRQEDFRIFCKKRGSQFLGSFPVQNPVFEVEDWDFPDDLWQHWETVSQTQPQVWSDILRLIAEDWENGWSKYTKISAYQWGWSNRHDLDVRNVMPGWVIKLRQLPCLPDAYSNFHHPAELYVRNQYTAPLENVERFVHPDFDNETFLPLLRLLGVRERPEDVGKLIQRLRALSESPQPPLPEVIRIYDALERVLSYLSKGQLESIQKTFAEQKLILGENRHWYSSCEIYQENPQKIPGLQIILPDVASKSLWDRLNVVKQPTAQDALKWLMSLSLRVSLTEEDAKRVAAIQRRYPEQVYFDCKRWLNLKRELCSVVEMEWIAEDLDQGRNLFDWALRKTADFSMISNPAQFLEQTGLKRLANVLQYKIHEYRNPHYVPNPEWIPALAKNLLRIQSPKQSSVSNSGGMLDFDNLRQQAQRLSETRLLRVQPLQATPYIEGQQAGYPMESKVLWHQLFFLVLDSPENHINDMVSAVTLPFKDALIQKAIEYSIDRDAAWIDNYFSTYFVLSENPQEAASFLENADRPEKDEGTEVPRSDFVTKPIESTRTGFEDESFEKEAEDDLQSSQQTPTQRQPKPPMKPEEKFSLFIHQEGFHWQKHKKTFTRLDGHEIYKEQGVFPFVEYDPQGFAVRRFRLLEGDLKKGVVIPAEVIELMRSSQADEYLLVVQQENDFVLYNWAHLSLLLSQNQLILQPAAYRLKST